MAPRQPGLPPQALLRGTCQRRGSAQESPGTDGDGRIYRGETAAGGTPLETPRGQGRRRRTGSARRPLHGSALRRPAGASAGGGGQVAYVSRGRYRGERGGALREFG